MPWFELRGDERINERCASEGCPGQPTYRLEAEGAGSNFCSGCKAMIERNMSRLGTCRHCWQIQTMYRVPLHPQPHEPAETRIDQPEEYTCQWLDGAGALPPPIKRMAGGFLLRPTDCDTCPRYEVVSVAIPGMR